MCCLKLEYKLLSLSWNIPFLCDHMLNLMHHLSDVINTPFAAYGKCTCCIFIFQTRNSPCSLTAWNDLSLDVGTYRMEYQTTCALSCWGCFLVPISSEGPLWSCFLMANMASKCLLSLPRRCTYTHAEHLVLIQMFYALMEHICKWKTFWGDVNRELSTVWIIVMFTCF